MIRISAEKSLTIKYELKCKAIKHKMQIEIKTIIKYKFVV